MTDTTASLKKTSTRRKTVTSTVSPIESPVVSVSTPSVKSQTIAHEFSDLFNTISSAREEFERTQKEIGETKEAWLKEQKDHELQLKERNQQEELARRRESEQYEYETKIVRRQAQDEFEQKKYLWERDLASRKEEIGNNMQELAELRKQVAGFETEKITAVKEACAALEKSLKAEFETGRKLREQEVKAEKELLSLRLTNLTNDNTRQTQEIESLKKTLDDATKQFKEIAVKVIESGSPPAKSTTAQET